MANLNNTIINGQLRVTDNIYGGSIHIGNACSIVGSINVGGSTYLNGSVYANGSVYLKGSTFMSGSLYVSTSVTTPNFYGAHIYPMDMYSGYLDIGFLSGGIGTTTGCSDMRLLAKYIDLFTEPYSYVGLVTGHDVKINSERLYSPRYTHNVMFMSPNGYYSMCCQIVTPFSTPISDYHLAVAAFGQCNLVSNWGSTFHGLLNTGVFLSQFSGGHYYCYIGGMLGWSFWASGFYIYKDTWPMPLIRYDTQGGNPVTVLSAVYVEGPWSCVIDCVYENFTLDGYFDWIS